MTTRAAPVADGDLLLMIGTTKGAFLLRGGAKREKWERHGPFFPGHEVYAMAFDGRNGRRRIWIATSHAQWGPMLRHSDDLGRSWGETKIAFPSSAGASVERVWQLVVGPSTAPGTLWAGTDPAALFSSADDGATWTLAESLWRHPQRAKWQPGFGGLCLHTILPHPDDPRRMLVAISSGGVYRTDDGGASWQPSNRGIRADFLPDKHPEFGQCVHKIARHPARAERLFLQNHGGLYRSDDDGATWEDVARGVPSDFGFPVAIHPRDPHTAWVVPLQSDQFRCTPGGKLRVYRTRNGGMSWQPQGKGLPQQDAWETVLRDALAVDTLDPAGVYFGTRSGRVFASRDEGRGWKRLVEGLPPVCCVKVASVGRRVGAQAAKGRSIVKRPRRRKKAAPSGKRQIRRPRWKPKAVKSRRHRPRAKK